MNYRAPMRERLRTDPAILAARASVEWSRRPPGFERPAIVLTTVYDPRGRTMTGRQGFNPLRLYIDVMTTSSSLTEQLRNTVLALIGFGDVRGGIRFWPARNVSVTDQSEQTDTVFIFRDQIDTIIPYKET